MGANYRALKPFAFAITILKVSISACRGLDPSIKGKLVCVEGMYSMYGDIAPIKEFVEVSHKHGAYLFVDEAHSFGVYGPTGRGVSEADGVMDQIDFYSGTFSKSLAAIGGFIASNHRALDYLRFSARPYMFTASPSPATIASASAALAEHRRDTVDTRYAMVEC